MRLRHLSLGAYARGVLSLSHTCARERPLNLSSSKSCEIGKRNEIIQMGAMAQVGITTAARSVES